MLCSTTVNPSVCSGADGSINLSVSPVGTYTYSWTNASGVVVGTSEDISGLSAGAYTVVVSQGSCTSSLSVTLSDPSPFTLSVTKVDESLCGAGDGSIDLIVSPSAGSYVYSWTNSAGTVVGTSQDMSGLLPDTYTVSVISGSCVSTTSVVINGGSVGFALSSSVVNPSVCSGADGSINLSVSAVGTYTYSWTNASGTVVGTSEDISGLSAGVYTVVVSQGTCTATLSVTLSDPSPFTLSATKVDESLCGAGDGSINLSVSPSAGSYVYSWTNSAGTVVGTSQDMSGLLPDTYTVSVISGSCVSFTSIVINKGPVDFVLSSTKTNPSICGGADGSINLSITPTGSYTYEWSNSSGGIFATTEDVSGLSAGVYTVITSQGTCRDTLSVTLSDPIPFTITVNSVTNVSRCGDTDGAIDITVTGASGSQTYLWKPIGLVTQDLSGLAAGNYTVIVTDGACKDSLTVVVGSPSLSLNTTHTDPTTCNTADGTITLMVGNTVAGVTSFTWKKNNVVIATTQNLTGLSSGTYVGVVSSGTCLDSVVVTLMNPNPFTFNNTIVVDGACGASAGSIQLSLNGAISPVVKWVKLPSTILSQTGLSLTGLAKGVYRAVVADGACKDSIDITVNELLTITATGVNPTQCGGTDGQLSVTTNAVSPVITWTNVATGTVITDLSSASAGTYKVVIKTPNCKDSALVTLTNPVPFTIGGATITPVSVNGGNDGSITGLIVTGASGSETYVWKKRPSTYTAGATIATAPTGITNLTAGVYVVFIKDGACIDSVEFVVPQPLNVTADVTDAITCGGSEGTIILHVQGATSAATYSWIKLPSTPIVGDDTLTGLSAGTYQVTIQDGSITTTQTYVVNEPIPLKIASYNIVNPTCLTTGSIAVSIVNGSGKYGYTWLSGTIDLGVNNDTITGLTAGTYQLSVVDSITNCTKDTTFTLVAPDALKWQIAVSQPTCATPAGGSITLGLLNGSGNYTFSGDLTTAVTNGLAAGSYTVSVLDNVTGCSKIDTTIVLNAPTGCVTICDIDFTLGARPTLCEGSSNGVGLLFILGSHPASYKYRVDKIGGVATGFTSFVEANTALTQLTNLPEGMLKVTVADTLVSPAYSCIGSDSVDITASVIIKITRDDTQPTCLGNDGRVEFSKMSEADTVTYTYAFGDTLVFSSQTLYTGLKADTTYYYKIKTGDGCTLTDSVRLQGTTPIHVAAVVTDADCQDNGGAIALTVIGGSGDFTFLGDLTAANTTGLGAGTYNVVIRDNITLCTKDTAIVVGSPVKFSLQATLTQPACTSTGSVVLAVSNGSGNYSFSGDLTAASTSGLNAGSYTVHIVDNVSGCIKDTTVVLDAPVQLKLQATLTQPTCTSTGSVVFAVSDGSGNYSFSGDLTAASTSGLNAGSYTVHIVDNVSGCIKDTTVVLDAPVGCNPVCNINFTLGSVPTVCPDGNDGTGLLFILSGNPASYKYRIDKVGGVATGSTSFVEVSAALTQLTNLPAGMLKITVSDTAVTPVYSCIKSDSINIASTILVNVQRTDVQPSCIGNDGSVLFTKAVSDTVTYTYMFGAATVFSGQNTYDNLAAGVYPYQIKTGNGCILKDTVILAAPASVRTFAHTTDANCNGVGGSVVIDSVYVGGVLATAPFQYSFSMNGPYTAITSVPFTIPNLPAGSRTLFVRKGSQSCIDDTLLIINNNAALKEAVVAVSSSEGQSSCANAPIVYTATDVNAVGNTSYTWFINGTPVTGNVTDTLAVDTLTQNAVITVIMNSTSTCLSKSSDTAVFNQIVRSLTPQVSIKVPNGLSGQQCNPTVFTFIADTTQVGSGATFEWFVNGVPVSPAVNNDTLVMDTAFTVSQPVKVVVTSADACANPITDTASYNVDISTGVVTPTLTILAYHILADGSQVLISPNDTLCEGEKVAFKAVATSAGATPTYDWYRNNNQFLFTSPVDSLVEVLTIFNPNSPRLLISTMLYASGACADPNPTDFVNFKVMIRKNIPVNVTLAPAIVCSSTPVTFTASSQLDAVSGVTYNFLVNGISVQNGSSLTYASTGLQPNDVVKVVMTAPDGFCYNPSPDTATVTVRAANDPACNPTNCNYTVVVTPTNPTACTTNDDGVIKFTIGNGTGIYQFTIDSTAVPVVWSFNNTFTGLAPGTYHLAVRDTVSKCVMSITQELVRPASIVAFASAHKAATCYGASNGQAKLDSVHFGNGTYQYSLSGTGFLPLPTDSIITGLPAGNITIYFRDVTTGCIAADTVHILQPDSIDAVITQTQMSQCNASTGIVKVDVLQGGTAPYTYVYNGVAGGTLVVGQEFNSLAAGLDTLVVVDAAGCSRQYIFEVKSTTPTVALADLVKVNPNCSGSNTGSITITNVTGGTGPYTVTILPLNQSQIFDPAAPSSIVFNNLTSQVYTVKITDNTTGCSSGEYLVALTSPPAVSFAVSQVKEATCNNADGEAIITSFAGTPPYSYQLNGGSIIPIPADSTSLKIIGLAAGAYTITLYDNTNSGNCATTKPLVIGGTRPLNFTENSKDIVCHGEQNGSITFTNVSGAGTYTVTLTNSSTGETRTETFGNGDYAITGLKGGIYNIKISQGTVGLCYTEFNIVDTIAEPAKIAVTYTYGNGKIVVETIKGGTVGLAGYSVSFDQGVYASITKPYGTDPAEYDTTYTITGAKQYLLSIRDSLGCQLDTLIDIPCGNIVPFIKITESKPSPEKASGQILITAVTGGTAPYYVSLNGAAFEELLPIDSGYAPVFQDLREGEYTLTFKDALGCTLDSVVVVPIDSSFLIPNVITPNGDGYNDKWIIRNLPREGVEVEIVNRWGKKVFKTNNYGNDWDGSGYPDGVYFYSIHMPDGKKYKGWIEIVDSRK
ncbi:gliding motility-associated C-terminal domain-containing protein [Flexibacter flexilis DSM 6793]|uniref:Gliding motility-associated C-terminal domain-containing protein n=1 Tax=Flexibacter flexilis DSM 6793 TaxID=927664 RepID=A0A1I1NKM4_9BACT|nr:gliding motility-associated C-terminal domain-containing protein [Flexibacter flexilis]SFC97842.1 gliding motility-associated C-terminal domain-containing protein [Flexibacter flexilis DSM 6793]